MTPEGAVQHYKNGQLLRKAYVEKWKLFDGVKPAEKVKVISTTKSRTYQSAIAFMQGFVPEVSPDQMHIVSALDNRMCTRTTDFPCACPALGPFVDAMSTNFRQTSPEHVSQKKVQDAYSDIARVMKATTKELPRSTHIMDIAMVHACHGLPLPGIYGTCIKPSSFINLHATLEKNGAKNQKNQNFNKVARLKMLPFLHDIYSNIMGLIESKTQEKFILYSGHDTTIEPLISTLGLTDGTWPPYASRFVVETYSFDHGGHKHLLLRILFNGKDVTSDVLFCKGERKEEVLNDDGLCPIDLLTEFFEEKTFKDLGIDETYQELCAETFL